MTPRNDASALAAGMQAMSIQPVGSYESDAQHYTTVQPGGSSPGTHPSLQSSPEPRVYQHGTTHKFNQRAQARDKLGLNAGPLYTEQPGQRLQQHPWLERSRSALICILRAQTPPRKAPEPKHTTRTAIPNALMNQRAQVGQVTNSMGSSLRLPTQGLARPHIINRPHPGTASTGRLVAVKGTVTVTVSHRLR